MAAVTVVFDRLSLLSAEPADVATQLLASEDVITVRVSAHGRPSGYRVDVTNRPVEEAAACATDICARVASELRLSSQVISVGLSRDDERIEIYRLGARGTDLVWGER